MPTLYLVRHGVAVDQADWARQPDDDRPLTSEGRRRFRKLAGDFAEHEEEVAVIVSSPLPRAVMTAEILANAIGCDAITVSEALRPGRTAADAIEEAVKLWTAAERSGGLALVGHEPGMTKLAEKLVGESLPRLNFRKGAIFRFDVETLPPRGPAHFRWWMSPKSRTRNEALPLEPDDAR